MMRVAKAGANLGAAPFFHAECEIAACDFGPYVEIGKGSRLSYATLGEYSYSDRYADIGNAAVGKFAKIASFARIGPPDRPMTRASRHHFLHRSSDYWDDAEVDADFFAERRARIAWIGHDTCIGHNAVIRRRCVWGTVWWSRPMRS